MGFLYEEEREKFPDIAPTVTPRKNERAMASKCLLAGVGSVRGRTVTRLPATPDLTRNDVR